MLAWMDGEALRLTRETGEAHFFSRSRDRLWRKGETSGNTLAVEELRDDCDGDAYLLRVRANGPACHTGSVSCFAPWLWRTVARARGHAPGGLLRRGAPRRRARRGRAEARRGGRRGGTGRGLGDDERVVELADLWFRSYVALAARGLDPAPVEDELERRASSPRLRS